MARMEDELVRFTSEYGPAWAWTQEYLEAAQEDVFFWLCGMIAQRWQKPKGICFSLWVHT